VVGKQIFGSNAERHNYHHLCQIWGDKWHLYPNQPFRNFCATQGLIDFSTYEFKSITLSPEEKELLNKTSVDYVLCTPQGEVVLGIEFDGVGEGFSRGTTYCPTREVSDARKRMLDLKLRVAHASATPFLIVGTQEFAPLGSRCNLAVIDGIIGRILSGRARQCKFAVEFRPEMAGFGRDTFENGTQQEQHLIIEDYALGVEVMSEMENDPLELEISRRERKLGACGWSLSYPSAEEEGIAECAVTMRLGDGSTVSSHVRLRDFASDFFFMASLLENVAQLSALLNANQSTGVA
jgi:hypothetical protein